MHPFFRSAHAHPRTRTQRNLCLNICPLCVTFYTKAPQSKQASKQATNVTFCCSNSCLVQQVAMSTSKDALSRSLHGESEFLEALLQLMRTPSGDLLCTQKCTAAMTPHVLAQVSCTAMLVQVEVLMQMVREPSTRSDIIITSFVLPEWVLGTPLERFVEFFLYSPEFRAALQEDDVTRLRPWVVTDPTHHPQANPHLETLSSGCSLPLYLWQRRDGKPAPGATSATPRGRAASAPAGIDT